MNLDTVMTTGMLLIMHGLIVLSVIRDDNNPAKKPTKKPAKKEEKKPTKKPAKKEEKKPAKKEEKERKKVRRPKSK